jgi:hypothetical protein
VSWAGAVSAVFGAGVSDVVPYSTLLMPMAEAAIEIPIRVQPQVLNLAAIAAEPKPPGLGHGVD